jgi:hypothetical protein
MHKMDAAEAISLVADFILWRNLDYRTEGLAAERLEAGWSVYAPADVDDGDPMALLEMRVGRAMFLVGDSGRIEEASPSIPPQQAQAEFTAQELAAQQIDHRSDESEFTVEFERQLPESNRKGLRP